MTGAEAAVAMTDHFAMLGAPRRPWLEPEPLKQEFLTQSAAVHPDRVHGLGAAKREEAQQHYTDLNSAFNVLLEPRTRLRHLLELELGRKPSDLTQVPEDLMTVFFSVGQMVREADAFLAEKNRSTSPLIRVQYFERSMEWTDKLRALHRDLDARREGLVSELKAVDADWQTPASPEHLAQLEQLYRLFSYHDRWLAQVREREAQLAL